MAILKNMWLRGASQKLGGVVLYTRAGETVARELAPSSQNPRTEAQMNQRVRLANVVNFYKASASWMRGAFESKKAGSSDYNAFVSANLSANQVALTKSEAAAGAAVVAPYQVTRGSLNPVEITGNRGDSAITNINMPELDITDTTYIGEFAAELLDNNNLPEGAQLSLIRYIQKVDEAGTPYISCQKFEVILDRNDLRPLAAFIPEGYLTGGSDNGKFLGVKVDDWQGGFALVISKTVAGRLYVSTSTITLTPSTTTYDTYTSEARKQAAIDSYGVGTETFLSSNNANTAGGNAVVTPQIQFIRIGTRGYGEGDRLPASIPEGTEVTVQLTTPIEAGTWSTITWRNESTSTDIGTMTANSNQGVTNAVQFTATANIEFPQPSGQQIGIEMVFQSRDYRSSLGFIAGGLE